MALTPEPAQQAKRIDLTTDPTVGLWIFVLDVAACVFWIYTVTTLFIFDFPRYLITYFVPGYVWILDFKIAFFLGLAALVAIFIDKLTLVFWALYILLFPMIFLFWKIPKHVFKTGSLNIIFYFLFSAVSLFKGLKYNIFGSFVALSSAMVIVLADNKIALYIASILLGVLLFAILSNRVISVLKPGDTFVFFRKVASWWQDVTLKKIEDDTDFKQFSLLTAGNDEARKQIANVEFGLISNRIVLLTAKGLRNYQNSGITAVSSIFVTLFLLIATTVFTSFIYYAVYKIDPTNYTFSAPPNWFTFFALSFKGMINSSINELTPVTTLSQAINIAQNFMSLFIVVIFASIIITSRNQVISYQLDETIKRLQEDGHAIERAMMGRYQIKSIEDLMSELRRLKAGSLTIAEYFTKKL